MASLIRILTTLLIAVGFTAPTMAQSDLGNWPTQRPIKMIAVFPPGGSVDQVARILAPV
ncbi:MAG: tripartite tricarboxylate transporter substrate binding protein, partial [Burkholderiaceae bacterium]|nr:tripartite tricarboxylate transporter substrate binding protein [Burkholderiaceae bacterium]